jgi:Methyltransferase domain
MGKIDWREFWRTYRETEIENEKDLYFEVGKTVDQQPISEEALRESVQIVARGLALTRGDKLLELCCGNGLMTRCLAAVVEEIYAVDFAERLIWHARRFRPAPNVRYVCADAVGFVKELCLSKVYIPSKVLLGDALGYFEPAMVGEILTAACYLTGNRFTLMATGIPSDHLKWNFYNTPERVRRYEDNQLREGNTNDGIGRWWRTSELGLLARERGLRLTVLRQPRELSDFRVDAIFSCNP